MMTLFILFAAENIKLVQAVPRKMIKVLTATLEDGDFLNTEMYQYFYHTFPLPIVLLDFNMIVKMTASNVPECAHTIVITNDEN